MKMVANLKQTIARISRINNCGFTFNPSTRSFATRGYVVASKDTQDCIGKKGLFKVIKYYLSHPEHFIGGWKNEDGEMQYDASKVYFDINEAIVAAIDNAQRAIFNLYTGQVIFESEFGYYMTSKISA